MTAPRSSRAPLAAGLAVAAALALSACHQPPPADALWPTDPLADFGDPWVPDLFVPDNAGEFAGLVRFRRGYVEASAVPVIDNLDPDEAVAVFFLDRNGSQQAVRVPAGGSLGVAAFPERVLSVRR